MSTFKLVSALGFEEYVRLRSAAAVSRFMNVPLGDLDREDLLAVIGWLDREKASGEEERNTLRKLRFWRNSDGGYP